MIYLELFWTFLIIGTFTIGGGYAMLSLIQSKVVISHEWISMEQFTDIVAISQTTPGPIGINSATYIGYTVTHNMGYPEWACVCGSILATFAVVIPSFIIVLAICRMFQKVKQNTVFDKTLKDLRPIVIGLIAAAAGILMNTENFFHWTSWLLFGITFICCYWLKFNPILTMLAAGAVGLLIY